MVISGFQALQQARAPVMGLEPATEGSLQISGRIRYPLCHRRPQTFIVEDKGGRFEPVTARCIPADFQQSISSTLPPNPGLHRL
ncbi:hypothetical protein PoB_001643400 [Plakobranchus ocellatus]|uniref:Uncharacterized protein n=1 Tax=Plakobranchus ocellatus TaxID=259542 RepID=A0AAV3Z6B7_9GAST|nr:hypothetical protein PoB_001643400 [Plakobranchus ocellatus]